MTMTVNGISTTAANGTEQYDSFTIKSGRKTYKRIQYDYRHTDGRLFSCVCETLEACRTKRDNWLATTGD